MCQCIFNLDMILKILTFIGGIYTIILAFYKYNDSVNRNKAKVLSDFNQRFTTDPILVKVTKSLTNTASALSELTLYDIETYCRFGEELEIAIRDGYLNANDVRNMFWFYIDKAKEYLTDYDNENWSLLKSLSKRMNFINE